MKSSKLLLTMMLIKTLFSSCILFTEEPFEDLSQNNLYIKEIVSEYDLWYIDYHRTLGDGDIPFVSRAFTMSFVNGIVYANNNIVDIGNTGNGFGIAVGTYNSFNGLLEVNHHIDGPSNFEVMVLSNNEISLYNPIENVNYYLIGYQIPEFDYENLFYENIEYFLQEYIDWEKTAAADGIPNPFDNENYMAFTPENMTTFYSSKDNFNTQINDVYWNFIGEYEVYDIRGYEDLKILTLNYDDGDIEEFELSIINDGKIQLYHLSSKTTYRFSGRGFMYYSKREGSKKEAKNSGRNEGRKRTKVSRKTKHRSL
jgi:hypothetical protein